MIESNNAINTEQTLELTIKIKFGSQNQLNVWLEYIQVFWRVFAEHFRSKHKGNSITVNATWK